MRHAVLAVAVLLLTTIAMRPGDAMASSVVDLQPRRTEASIPIVVKGQKRGTATLTNLNPDVGRWWLLRLEMLDGSIEHFHLENSFPETQRFEIDPEHPNGVVIVRPERRDPCLLWPSDGDSPLQAARKTKRPYVGLCDDRLYLRSTVTGHRTKKEWATDLLRDRVRYGDQITNFVKEKIFRDRYMQTGQPTARGAGSGRTTGTRSPAPVLVRQESFDLTLNPRDLNFVIPREPGGGVIPGHWYAIEGYPGVHIATVTPNLVSEEIVRRQRAYVNPLDPLESAALVYLTAFDLSLFEVGFMLGTEHPRVNWSDRVPETSQDASIAGPDGFETIWPLVRTGKLDPQRVVRVAATFAGGFKRSHGAFKSGVLAMRNHGSHYGFIESGVVLSTLHPGLATFLLWDDGRVELRTWTDADKRSVDHVLHARQNGVPLLEPDPVTGITHPGALVRQWGLGNWSGSQEKQLRTLRGGACIQEVDGRRFLIYGYFSSVTPSAMARVFEACQCRYALQLDINAPEHTYLAIYRIVGSEFVVQRLVKEMGEVDPTIDGLEVPRFIGYSDNRDFFYLLRR